jgi:hypothetical protein
MPKFWYRFIQDLQNKDHLQNANGRFAFCEFNPVKFFGNMPIVL